MASGWYSLTCDTGFAIGGDEAFEPFVTGQVVDDFGEFGVVFDEQQHFVTRVEVGAVIADDGRIQHGRRQLFRFRRYGLGVGTAVSLAVASATRPIGRYNVNALPLSCSLTTSICPPNFAANSREIDRPNPVPPYWRLVLPSACGTPQRQF